MPCGTNSAAADDISCVSATDCVAGGSDGSPAAWIYDGSSWSSRIAVTPNAGDTIGRLSCPSSEFCAYVPTVGNTG